MGGINTVSIHNQALGQLEICKAMLKIAGADDTNFNDQAIFHFSIDGATSGPLSDVQVAAGHCSMPLVVNAGQHTIRENLARTTDLGKPAGWAFEFVGATATGPTGDNRVVGPGGNPVTVNVPYFADPANGGETLVTITNRVLRAQVKICKIVDPGSLTALGANVWQYSVDAIGHGGTGPSYASNGTCTGLIVPQGNDQSAGWQVINGGNPVTVEVTEATFSGSNTWFISGASLDSGGAVGQLPSGTLTWNLVPGVNVLTITNTYGFK